jgi:protoporphyrin/coproporphyrin ferrochelatase
MTRAVVLLQMGGPSSLDELRPFYERLFADQAMIQLPGAIRPAQPALARLIATVRSRSMRARYEQIGGGSPLRQHTHSLATALQDELAARGDPRLVHYAMRYSHPLADAVAAELVEQGLTELVLLPLYPHWSDATSGSSIDDFTRAAHAAGYGGSIEIVRAWGDDPRYLDLVASWIEATRAELASQWDGPIHLLFSAHGLPTRYVERGDGYPNEVASTARQVAERVAGFEDWHLSFQSRMGPVKWLEPSTDTLLKRLAARQVQAIVAVPLGFVSDHIETLYDLDIRYREQAHTLGVRHYRRVPSFNADPGFARALADILASN